MNGLEITWYKISKWSVTLSDEFVFALCVVLCAILLSVIWGSYCRTRQEKARQQLQIDFVTSITFGEVASIAIKLKDIPGMLHRSMLIDNDMLITLNKNIKKGLYERLRMILRNKNMRVADLMLDSKHASANVVIIRSEYPRHRGAQCWRPSSGVMRRCRSIWEC